MTAPQRAIFGTDQIMEVFSKKTQSGKWLYTTDQATAAVVYITVALAQEGRLTMGNLPPTLDTLCNGYFKKRKVSGATPAELGTRLRRAFNADIPAALLNDLSAVVRLIVREGGTNLAETLAAAAGAPRFIERETTNGLAPPKAKLGVGPKRR